MYLPELPNETLNIIFYYLSGPDLVVLASTGAQVLETKILKQICITEFVLNGSTDKAQILKKKTCARLQMPQILFKLPFLSTFVMISPKGRQILSNFWLASSMLEKLPPTLTHLELKGLIDIVTDDKSMFFFNLGARFTNLITLKLDRDGDTYMLRSFSWRSFYEMLPPTLQCLGLWTPSRSEIADQLAFLPSNLTSLCFYPHGLNLPLSKLTHLNLTHFSASSVAAQSTFKEFVQLTSLELTKLEPPLLETFPSSLTNLVIQNMPNPFSWFGGNFDMHWSRAIRNLPRSLISLSLGSLVFPYCTMHPFDNPLVPSKERAPEEITTYQNEIFPKNLRSLKLDFSFLETALAYFVGDPCFIFDILPTSVTQFHFTALTKLGLATPSFKAMPPCLTSLKFLSPIPFQDDFWQHFQTLRHFEVACALPGIPEAALFASDFPKNLACLKIAILNLDGTSWHRILKKSHLPRYQAFIKSYSRANKRAYIDAVKFEISQMHSNVQISQFEIETVMVLPPASTSVNWKKLHLSSVVVDHTCLQDFPKGLTTLNLKQFPVPLDFISNLPSTLKTIFGGYVRLSTEEADKIASAYFDSWESIEIPGSFSRALQLQYPALKNIGIYFENQPRATLVQKWLHEDVKSLRLKNLEACDVFALLNPPCRLPALRKLRIHDLSSLSDGGIFDRMPKLMVMICSLSGNSLAHLPQTLTDLTLVKVEGLVSTPRWPPNMTKLKVENFTRFLEYLEPNSMPLLKILDLGPNIRVDGSLVLNIPRSVTSLRIKSFPFYTPKFAENLPPNLQFIKLAYGGPHASDIHQEILQRRGGFELLGK